MNRKILIIIVFAIIAVAPWIFISQQYGGLNNITHNDITMWIFMLNYITLFAVIGIGVLMFISKDNISLSSFLSEIWSPQPRRESDEKVTEKEKEEKSKDKSSKEKKEPTKQDKEKIEWANLYKEARR